MYLPFLRLDPLVAGDDELLLTPLQQMSSFSEYPGLLMSGRVMDLQPVRDASWYADIRLKRLFPFHGFHLTNLLLWLLILELTFRIIRHTHPKGNMNLIAGAMLLYAIHPVFTGSIAWVAARKHLLACLFTLGATYAFLRAGRSKEGSAKSVATIHGCYLLSIFSHPIGVLWPLWAMFTGRGRRFWIAASCIPAMVLCLYLNYRYYSGAYVQQTGVEKLLKDTDVSSAGFAVLAQGRYLINFLAPFKLAPIYYLGNPWNLAGTVLLPFVGLILYKAVPLLPLLSWTAFYFLPLLLITHRPTNIFVSNTYFLISGVGLLNLLLFIPEWPKWSATWRRLSIRALVPAGAAVAILFIYLSAKAAAPFQSVGSYRRLAYQQEASPTALLLYSRQLIDDGYYPAATESLLRLKAWSPEYPGADRLLAKAIYLDPHPTPRQKIDFLRSEGGDSSYSRFAAALLLSELRDYDGAFVQLEELAIKHPEQVVPELNVGTIGAHLAWTCSRSRPHRNCDEALRQVREGPLKSRWDEKAYQERMAHLISDDLKIGMAW